MHLNQYIGRIKTIAQGLRKQQKVRSHSHALLMSSKEYTDIAKKMELQEGKYMSISKLVLVSVPFIGKRKYQVMKWGEYLDMWSKYKKVQEMRERATA